MSHDDRPDQDRPDGGRRPAREQAGGTLVPGDPADEAAGPAGGGSEEPTRISGGKSDGGEAPTQISSPGEAPTQISGAEGEAPTQAGTTGSGAGGGGAGTAFQPGQILGTRYEIEKLLGEGGFGAVYRARDRVLDRTVALKLIHPGLANHGEIFERFKREILLASKVTHRNVVRVHDLVEIDDLRLISMEFVEGRDLASLLEEEGPLPVDRAMPIARQIAEALAAAHAAGVVHRDLKPQNVLLDAESQAYVADFGISRSLEGGQTMTETGQLVGTMAYMSPEQARGEIPDHRADIYAFGLMLYQMLSGELPFESPNALSSLMKRLHEDVPSVGTKVKGVPLWVARVVAKATARDLDSRYQTVSELLADLESQHAARVRKKRAWGRVAGVVGGVVGVAIVAIAAWSLLPDRGGTAAGPVPLKASLAIAPFHNVKADPAFDWAEDGLPDLLRGELEQERSLRLVPAERARQVAGDLQLLNDGELEDPEIGRLASILNVDTLVTADLYTGESFTVDARLYRMGASDQAVATRIRLEASSEDELLDVMEQLGSRLRTELGLSGRRERDSGFRTESVEALRAFTAARTDILGGNDLDAVDSLVAAIDADPGFNLARVELAEVYERLGRLEEARATIDEALAGVGDASEFEAARVRAVRARLGGDPAEAEASYRELVALAPNEPENHFALASFLEDAGDIDGALTAIAAAIALDETNPLFAFTRGRLLSKSGRDAEAAGEIDRAEDGYKNAGNKQGQASVLNARGLLAADTGEAIRFFMDAVELRQEIGDLRGEGATLTNIAFAHASVGDFESSIRTQRQALEVLQQLDSPEEIADARLSLGEITLAAGRTQDAAREYRLAYEELQNGGIDSGPVVARALGNLGYVNLSQGNYFDAGTLLDQALEKKEALGDPGELLYGLIEAATGKEIVGRFARAEELYGRAARLATEREDLPARLVTAINLANVHRERGKFGSAHSTLEASRELVDLLDDPRLRSDWLMARALLSTELGAVDEAAADWAGSLAAAESGGPAQVARVRIREAEARAGSDPEKARQLLEAAVPDARAAGDQRLLKIAEIARAIAEADADGLRRLAGECDDSRLRPQAVRARLALARLASEATDAADAAVAAARETGQSDLELQARTLALEDMPGAGPDRAAYVDDSVALLRGLLPDLSGAIRDRYLARPATRRFLDAAGLDPASLAAS